MTSTIPSARTASAVHGVYSCIEKGWTGHRSMSNSSPHFIPVCLAYALLSDPTKFQRTTRAHKNNLQLRKRDALSMHTLFENGNFPMLTRSVPSEDSIAKRHPFDSFSKHHPQDAQSCQKGRDRESLHVKTVVPISSRSVSSEGGWPSAIHSDRPASAINRVHNCIEKGRTGRCFMLNSVI